MEDFLPICREDMAKRGWDQADFVYLIGDAYVDHSSFGPAIISRVLEAEGYRVAILSQPDWKDPDSVKALGCPRLGFLISAGNMDSMVNHYTVSKKRRSEDAYTPGGKAGARPDYATIVYSGLVKRAFPEVPVIIGGIEASLRRLAHYDYWADKLKKSVLLDSGADLLLYGMGERAIVQLADALASGLAVRDICYIPGTVWKTKDASRVLEQGGILLPSYDSLLEDKRRYAESFRIQYENTDFASGKPLVEPYGQKCFVVQNPPAAPLTAREMDRIYELPYRNAAHPSYAERGGVPALSEVRFSLTSNRGCFGSCCFCALAFHQGRIVQARSHESLIREAEAMTKAPDFKGYIHDVGGPTANFRAPACAKQTEKGACPGRQCLYPSPCKNLTADHRDYVALLRKLRQIPGVKKVFIRSGIRFDYVMADKDDTFLRELCRYHISGQLRVAPEHVTDHVLDLMGKPRHEVYVRFEERWKRINGRSGKEQYLVPYLISSHPGSTLADAVALAESVRDMGYMPEQVQDFYPTPSTVSTCMYYTGLDPRTMKPVEVVRDPHQKALQRALIQYRKPENYELVKEALIAAGREDLIGFDRQHCLIPPRKMPPREEGGGPARKKDPGKDRSSEAGRPVGKSQHTARTGAKGAAAAKAGHRSEQAGGKAPARRKRHE